ncbi:MAG: hypothetical protein IJ055_02285 [Oscillospiraceae bacterium]|nr:hypothetical protein [Oscillospiraceae bacterium]
MLRSLWNKLSRKRDLWVRGAVVLGMAGLVLIAVPTLLPEKEAGTPQAEQETEGAYRDALEAQLTGMLSAMEGVGRVRVLVTIGSSESYHYAKEGDKLVNGDEVRSSSTYVTVGGSAKEPLVEYVTRPEITGVVVACDGAGSAVVEEAVYRAVGVACGLPSSRIYVTGLSSSGGRESLS